MNKDDPQLVIDQFREELEARPEPAEEEKPEVDLAKEELELQ